MLMHWHHALCHVVADQTCSPFVRCCAWPCILTPSVIRQRFSWDFVLIGMQDKDANVRVKAVATTGSAAAGTSLCSQDNHAELLVLLTHRLLQSIWLVLL